MTVAAVALAAMGISLVAMTVVDLWALVGTVLAAPGDDGMTVIVTLAIAGVLVAIMLVVGAIGGLQVAVALRILRRIRWAWIEGSAMALVGAAFAVVSLASTDAADPSVLRTVEPMLAGATIAGAVVVIGGLLVHRPWFGRLYLPQSDDDAPFWLRRSLRNRWP